MLSLSPSYQEVFSRALLTVRIVWKFELTERIFWTYFSRRAPAFGSFCVYDFQRNLQSNKRNRLIKLNQLFSTPDKTDISMWRLSIRWRCMLVDVVIVLLRFSENERWRYYFWNSRIIPVIIELFTFHDCNNMVYLLIFCATSVVAYYRCPPGEYWNLGDSAFQLQEINLLLQSSHQGVMLDTS